jgi:serine/threonine protein kinase
MYILTAGTQLGRFQLEHMLGKGGMGEVWKAQDPRLGRDVAVKILPPDMAKDPDLRARFDRESKILASLNHPYIAQIYEAGEEVPLNAIVTPGNRVAFLVMEFIEGKSLSELLHHGPLPVLTTVRLGRQISRALAAAHRAGIIHRDLKPANIMVTSENRAKVLDFGLARPLGKTPNGALILPEVTMPGVVMGTAAYLAPEQVKGSAADVRSDIWALGCVLYHMLAGHRAFDNNSVPEILAGILRDEPEDLEKLNPETPPALKALVEKCLDKNPDKRPRSALEVSYNLREIGHQLRFVREGEIKPRSTTVIEDSLPAPNHIHVENINRYLKMMNPQFPVMTLKKSGPAFVEVLHHGIKIGIIVANNPSHASSDLLILVAPLFKLPEPQRAAFMRKLLILSNGHTDIAQFAVDSRRGFVNLASVRLCENMDSKEFQYHLDTVSRIAMNIGMPLKAEFGAV